MNLKNYSQVHRLTAIAFILALALVPTANAANVIWTGTTSATWATGSNWSGGTTAGPNDIAVFNGSIVNQPTAVGTTSVGGLLFDSNNASATTITTGTGLNRLKLGSSGVQMNSGTAQVNLGAGGTQGIEITANQNWINNSASLLSVNRVSVDDASAAGTYTLTINGSGSGGTTFLRPMGDVNDLSDPNKILALVINTTGGNTTLTSANTFSGGVTLTQGRLVLNDNGAAGSGTLALNGGILASSGNRSYTNAVTIGGDVTFGDITPNNGKQTNSGTVNLGAGTRTLTTVTETTLSGVVSNGGITKQGASTLTFLGSSANTYTGLTTVSAGGLTLSKTAVDAIAGNVLVNGTGTLTLGAANQINNASDVEIAAGTFALGAFSDTVNNLKLTGGTITGSAGGILTSSTAYDFQSSGNVTGSLAGTAGANKTTAGTVTFTGANANTYTGLTTVSAGSLVLGKTASVVALAGDALVNGGTLQIVNSNQIQDSANVEVATGGTFAMGGNTDTVNGVKLTGGAITGTGVNGILTSITAYDLQSGSSSAVLAGAAGANKTTAGTVALNRANTYSGDTTLSAGTLQLGVASVGSVGAITSSAIGTGILGLNGGTLSSDSNANRTILNATTIGGDVTLGDAVANGTLTFSAGVDLSGIARTLTTASAINFNGVVSNGGINKAGESTLTLGGANTYSGLTTINQGTLAVTGSLLNTGTVLVNDGGSLSGSGSVGAVTLASGSVLRPGDSPGILTAASSIWQAGSTYSWEIDNATGLAETNWDVFSVTGELDMSALSSGAQMNLVLNSLSLANFDTSSTYTWVIAKAGSFTGYDDDNTNLTSLFDIDTANFNGGLPANLPTGGFQVVTGTDGSLRTLNLMAIPEPSTGTLLGFGLGGLVLTRLLRRKQS
jgi:autotransporter-associated beta strand protein